MHVIVSANQKGGVGKTTLLGHLAVEAQISGSGPVAIMDTDPQGSTAAWWNSRVAEDLAFAAADVGNLAAQLKDLKEAGYKVVFIDTPPSAMETIQAVINTATFVMVPTRASPHDLRAIGATVELCERAGIRPYFVLNGAAQRARITTEAAIALSQYGAVCPVVIYQRTDFASSMTDGRTVQELDGGSKGALEVKKLWEQIRAQLKKEKK
jgi:chromosome partitioning protein